VGKLSAATFICDDCGQTVTRNRKSGDALVCVECGIQRTLAAAIQLHSKSGPYYDKWLASKGVAGRPRHESSGE
jgi:DNA-directed RNA polymerase subunit RPC12/RpoP